MPTKRIYYVTGTAYAVPVDPRSLLAVENNCNLRSRFAGAPRHRRYELTIILVLGPSAISVACLVFCLPLNRTPKLIHCLVAVF